ncbi:TIGR02530 family flagellar biosynthesis protein [Sporolactobacillus vineae]|uniref:TIGR02530 family flagellar biosynthesis protein n=1 Tax=Sporolactobacillus vineae TaxID=444463 RepID=UPI000288CDD0|nr:TIGR02530 family flagellar biosynthesis protein [Sporolactobacillus vineae]
MTKIEQYPFYPLQVTSQPKKQKPLPKTSRNVFETALANELTGTPVKLTKHARERMASRNIHLSADEWNQIHDKMQEAEKKGVHDSLVLTPQAALVVNAPNNTVITAMKLSEAKSHIFTNINGTILLNH